MGHCYSGNNILVRIKKNSETQCNRIESFETSYHKSVQLIPISALVIVDLLLFYSLLTHCGLFKAVCKCILY